MCQYEEKNYKVEDSYTCFVDLLTVTKAKVESNNSFPSPITLVMPFVLRGNGPSALSHTLVLMLAMFLSDFHLKK